MGQGLCCWTSKKLRQGHSTAQSDLGSEATTVSEAEHAVENIGENEIPHGAEITPADKEHTTAIVVSENNGNPSVVAMLRGTQRENTEEKQRKHLSFYETIEAYEILPELMVGNLASARDEEFLRRKNVHFVLNLTNEPSGQVDGIKYKTIPLEDDEDEDLSCHLEECYRFISKAKAASTQKETQAILVHSYFGLSRASAVVLAYLMKEKGWSLREAHEYFIARHTTARPNDGFVVQLLRYEQELGNGTMTMTLKDFYNQAGPEVITCTLPTDHAVHTPTAVQNTGAPSSRRGEGRGESFITAARRRIRRTSQGREVEKIEIEKQQKRTSFYETVDAYEILPNLIVGNMASAHDEDFLRRKKVHFVLNLTNEPNRIQVDGIEYKSVPLEDDEDEDLSCQLEECYNFINKAKAASTQQAVLVHSYFGLSRTPAVVLAYLMKEKGWSLREAHEYFIARHPTARPNDGFIVQLLRYEQELGNGTVTMTLKDFYNPLGPGTSTVPSERVGHMPTAAENMGARNLSPRGAEGKIGSFVAATRRHMRKTSRAKAMEIKSEKEHKYVSFYKTVDAYEILPNVIIGNLASAHDEEFLRRKNVYFVLNLTKEPNEVEVEGIEYKTVPLDDDEDEDLSGHLEECYSFISKAKAASSKKETKTVLVHSYFGLSRTSAIVIAYLMKEKAWSLREAYDYFIARHPTARPNDGFIVQLLRYEQELGNGAMTMTLKDFYKHD